VNSRWWTLGPLVIGVFGMLVLPRNFGLIGRVSITWLMERPITRGSVKGLELIGLTLAASRRRNSRSVRQWPVLAMMPLVELRVSVV